MKITPLILLLITGCANWTPDEYYDSPDDKIIDSILYELDEDEDETVKLAQLMKNQHERISTHDHFFLDKSWFIWYYIYIWWEMSGHRDDITKSYIDITICT